MSSYSDTCVDGRPNRRPPSRRPPPPCRDARGIRLRARSRTGSCPTRITTPPQADRAIRHHTGHDNRTDEPSGHREQAIPVRRGRVCSVRGSSGSVSFSMVVGFPVRAPLRPRQRAARSVSALGHLACRPGADGGVRRTSARRATPHHQIRDRPPAGRRILPNLIAAHAARQHGCARRRTAPSHAAPPVDRTSACSNTVRAAASCLSGGWPCFRRMRLTRRRRWTRKSRAGSSRTPRRGCAAPRHGARRSPFSSGKNFVNTTPPDSTVNFARRSARLSAWTAADAAGRRSARRS